MQKQVIFSVDEQFTNAFVCCLKTYQLFGPLLTKYFQLNEIEIILSVIGLILDWERVLNIHGNFYGFRLIDINITTGL